jgi:hypothetical protein
VSTLPKYINNLTIINPNWDNHRSAVEDVITLHLDVDVLLIMSNNLTKIKVIEITEISDGNCPFCPDYLDDENDECDD